MASEPLLAEYHREFDKRHPLHCPRCGTRGVWRSGGPYFYDMMRCPRGCGSPSWEPYASPTRRPTRHEAYWRGMPA